MNSCFNSRKENHCIITGDEKWILYNIPKRKKLWSTPKQASTLFLQPQKRFQPFKGTENGSINFFDRGFNYIQKGEMKQFLMMDNILIEISVALNSIFSPCHKKTAKFIKILIGKIKISNLTYFISLSWTRYHVVFTRKSKKN